MLKRDWNFDECWYDEKTFDNGYYGFFYLGIPEDFPSNWYSVAISVSKKKKKVKGYIHENKNSNIDKTNVGSGIAPLIWAKQCILEFIAMKKNYSPEYPIYVCVYGEDAQRRRVYKWALTKIGFREGMFFGRMGLVYKIDKSE